MYVSWGLIWLALQQRFYVASSEAKANLKWQKLLHNFVCNTVLICEFWSLKHEYTYIKRDGIKVYEQS